MAYVLQARSLEVRLPASCVAMEDATYFANVLRSRACAVCGTDRKATSVLASPICAVCHATLDDGHAILAIAKGAAKGVCSLPCLEVVLQEGLAGGTICPACGSPWSAAAPIPRTCRTCAKALAFDAGYIGLWEGGRVVTFCGAACLEMHDTRMNPFCG